MLELGGGGRPIALCAVHPRGQARAQWADAAQATPARGCRLASVARANLAGGAALVPRTPAHGRRGGRGRLSPESTAADTQAISDCEQPPPPPTGRLVLTTSWGQPTVTSGALAPWALVRGGGGYLNSPRSCPSSKLGRSSAHVTIAIFFWRSEQALLEADHVRQPTVGFPAATSRLYTAGSTQHDRPAGLGLLCEA
eukprot:5217722-Prymnesium_polylepis.1